MLVSVVGCDSENKLSRQLVCRSSAEMDPCLTVLSPRMLPNVVRCTCLKSIRRSCGTKQVLVRTCIAAYVFPPDSAKCVTGGQGRTCLWDTSAGLEVQQRVLGARSKLPHLNVRVPTVEAALLKGRVKVVHPASTHDQVSCARDHPALQTYPSTHYQG